MVKICSPDAEVGQEQVDEGGAEEREAKRKKKKMAATASVKTRTGTVITIPPFVEDGDG